MSTGKISLIIIGVFILLLSIIGVSTYISVSNKEAALRQEVLAQQDVCKANFDKMYKVISQLAQIPQQFAKESKEAFKEIYPQLMEGRYANDKGGTLMKWVQESNPQYDMKAVGELYKKLANAIEANRNEYFMQQEILIDKNREHKTLLTTFPGTWILSGIQSIPITIITSTNTENAYKTGKEDNIDLFNK